jgi:hypothetical protein
VLPHLRRGSRGCENAYYHATKENEFSPVHSVIGFKKLNPSGFEKYRRPASEATPLLPFHAIPIQALTRQLSPLRIVSFYWPKSMKSPRLIILSFAFAILALMLISCETGPDTTTTTTTTSQPAVTGPPPPPIQSRMGGYSRSGY